MTKKILCFTIAMMFVLVGTAFAKAPDGNKRKGKYTYRKVYKACFERGEVQSKTPFISPSDKTMAQWERVFDKKDFGMFKCSEEFSSLTDAEREDIYTYLYNSAADSPTPAKCK